MANDIEIKSGNFEEKDCYVVVENDPNAIEGKNKWQEGIDEWRREQGDDKWKCPTEMSDNRSEDVLVSIKSPSDKTTVSGKEVTVKVKITTINSLKNVKIFLNDKEMKNYNEDKRDIEETFKDLSDDVYKLKVRATNDKEKSGESEIKFGLNKAWDYITPTIPVASASASP